MLEVKIDEAVSFKRIIDSLKELVSQVSFDCTPKKIQVQAMDDARVALAHLVLEIGYFDEFRCDRAISLGVDMKTISKVMKCSNQADAMRLQAEDDGNQLSITFQSKDNSRNSKFEINLIEFDSEGLELPNFNYVAELTFPSVELQQIVKNLSNFGDTITIQAKKDSFHFIVNDQIGKGSIVIQESASNPLVKIFVKEDISLTFSLKYLNQFCKGTNLGESVRLGMNDSSPLLVEFPLRNDFGSLKFFLAPKINEDE